MAKKTENFDAEIRSHLPKVEEEKRALASALMDELSFMRTCLTELRIDVAENGTTETYNNGGGQTGTTKSKALTAYCQLLPRYNSTMQTLLSMFPASEKSAVSGVLELDGFLGKAAKVKNGKK